jgi:hypothetical protein
MVTNYIEESVRRTNRNLFITNLLLLVGVFAVALLTSRYLYNVLSGPFAMDRQTLLGLNDVGDLKKYYVALNGDQVLSTGVNEITTETRNGIKTSEQVSANYVALAFDQHLLLVRAPVDYAGTHYTGSLQPIPTDVQQGVVDDIVSQEPQLKGVFLPFMLDAVDDFRTQGYIEIVAGVLLAALAIWNLIKFLQRMADPTAHPVYRALATYGPAEAVAASVDAEVAGPGATRIGSTVLTPHWLLRRGTYLINAVRLDDLVWVYRKVTQHRTYFVNTGKTYAAVLFTKQGKTIEITAKDAQATDIATNVMQRAPWAFVGYTPELVKAWKANRQSLIKAVTDRQHELKAQMSGG